jgi:GrpB-like predicted nucleotidyltransferase (UPF0157 family)
MQRQDPVVICDYDPGWSLHFAKLADRLAIALEGLVHRIEHIGSTAVPGLAAKPIVDIDVVLATTAQLPEVIGRLENIGYLHEGDLGIAGREAFRWPPGERRHHLYVLAEGAAELHRHLAFRNALRADPALRDRYAALKRSAAANSSHDRASYTEQKSTFITSVIGSC